jgi:hypothetical protein
MEHRMLYLTGPRALQLNLLGLYRFASEYHIGLLVPFHVDGGISKGLTSLWAHSSHILLRDR